MLCLGQRIWRKLNVNSQKSQLQECRDCNLNACSATTIWEWHFQFVFLITQAWGQRPKKDTKESPECPYTKPYYVPFLALHTDSFNHHNNPGGGFLHMPFRTQQPPQSKGVLGYTQHHHPWWGKIPKAWEGEKWSGSPTSGGPHWENEDSVLQKAQRRRSGH